MSKFSLLDIIHGGSEFGLYSSLSVSGGNSEVSDPFSSLGVLLDESLASSNSLSGMLGNGLLLSVWVGVDGSVDFLVNILASLCLGSSEALFPLGELSLEFSGIIFLEMIHIGGNMNSKDSVSVDLWVEVGLLLFGINILTSLVSNSSDLSSLVSWESLGLMGDVDSSVACSLECTEHSSTSGSPSNTDIKEGLEGSLVLHIFVNVEVVAVDIRGRFVHLRQADLLQESSGEQQSSAVSS